MNAPIVSNPIKKISLWAQLGRAPFHSVGVAPMVLGAAWASYVGGQVDWHLAFWAAVSVVLIMLSTYLAGEYYDQKEDKLSGEYGKSAFAGGSQVIQKGKMGAEVVRRASNYSALAVVAVGVFIQMHFKTGPWTLPLGSLGLLIGYFYSTPPIRLVKRGFGEIFIGFCYGYLPVFIAAYLQTGEFDLRLFYISNPIAISIFLVIWINQFADYKADKEAGKTNLVVRLGLEKAAAVYILGQALFIASIFLLQMQELLLSDLLFATAALAGLLAVAVGLGLYKNKKTLEPICGLTIVLNLATNVIFIVALLQ